MGDNALHLHLERLVLVLLPEVLHILVVEVSFLLPEDGRYVTA